jgi:hypothetical protein
MIFIIKELGLYNKIPQHYYWGLFGVIIGGLVLMLAPGNFARIDVQNTPIQFGVNHIIKYLKFEFYFLFSVLRPFWVIMFPISIVYYLFCRVKIKISGQSMIILFVGCISSIIMMFSPGYHNGTNLFFFYCILIVAISIFNFKEISLLLPKYSFLAIQIIITLCLQYYLVSNQIIIFNYANKLENEIITKKSRGEMDITVKKINLNTNRLIIYHALNENSLSPRNRGIAKYYGINTVKTFIESP